MVMITEKDFEEAKEKALDELMNVHNLDVNAALIVSLTALMFARLIKKYLFKEDDEN